MEKEDFVEYIDVLVPPDFESNGVRKPRHQAIADGDWMGTFNLWVINPSLQSVLYQVRSMNKGRAPGKLDVAVWGRYMAWESMKDGRREVQEELWIDIPDQDMYFIWRKIYVWMDTFWNQRRDVISLFFCFTDKTIADFHPNADELDWLCYVWIDQLMDVFTSDNSYEIEVVWMNGAVSKKIIDRHSFPSNRDNYHYKIARLAKSYLSGERDLIY